jgi:hypothetical protein
MSAEYSATSAREKSQLIHALLSAKVKSSLFEVSLLGLFVSARRTSWSCGSLGDMVIFMGLVD